MKNRLLRGLVVAALLAWGSATLYAALTDQLVAFWELESNGTDAHDDNDLGAQSSPVHVTGKVGNAGDFERGDNDAYTLADNADLSTGDVSFTICAWINHESLGGDLENNTFVSKSGGSHAEYFLYFAGGSGNNVYKFEVYGGSGYTNQGIVVASNFGTPSTSDWNFVCAWHDATNNQIGIQVDNGTPNTAAHSTGVYDSGDAFYIGNDAFNNAFDGLIDQVGFWKGRVLSSGERTDLYNSGSGVSYDDLAGGGAIAFVNADDGTFNAGGCDPCVSDAINVSSGNLVVATIRWGNGTTVTSAAGDIGDGFSLAVATNNGDDRISIYYKCGATADATYTVSFDMSASATFAAINLVQYSGIAATLCLDKTATGAETGGGFSVTSGSFTTSQADSVIVAAAQVAATGGNWTVGAGLTDKRAQDSQGVSTIADKIVSSVQSGVTTTLTHSDSANKTIAVATFVTVALSAGNPGCLLLLGAGCGP